MNWLFVGAGSIVLLVLFFYGVKLLLKFLRWNKDLNKSVAIELEKKAEAKKLYTELVKEWGVENKGVALTDTIRGQLYGEAYGTVLGLFPYGYQDEKTVEPGKAKEPRKILTLTDALYLIEAYSIIKCEIYSARGFPMVEEERDEAIGVLMKEWHGLDITDAEKCEIRRQFGDEYVSFKSGHWVYY